MFTAEAVIVDSEFTIVKLASIVLLGCEIDHWIVRPALFTLFVAARQFINLMDIFAF